MCCMSVAKDEVFEKGFDFRICGVCVCRVPLRDHSVHSKTNARRLSDFVTLSGGGGGGGVLNDVCEMYRPEIRRAQNLLFRQTQCVCPLQDYEV